MIQSIIFWSAISINIFKIKCQENYVYKSYQTTVYCQPSHPIHYPKTSFELHAIVKRAIASNSTVKVFGNRHSVTDLICTDGIPVDLSNINYVRVNSDGETATVGAGARLQDAMNALQLKGRALLMVPSYGGITVGGALGTGAHGSSLIHPAAVADQVVGLTIIDGLGKIRKLRRKETLRAFRVNLGLLGAVIDVTFKTVPSYKMTVHNYLESENILFNGMALEDAKTHDFYQLWWYPSSQSVVVSKGKYHTPEESEQLDGNAVTNLFPDLTPAEIKTARDTHERAQETKSLKAQQAMEEFVKKGYYAPVVERKPIFTEESGNMSIYVNPATGSAYRLQANLCGDGCLWTNGEDSSPFSEDIEMAVDINQFTNAITRIKAVLGEMPASFVLGIFIRFSRPSDALMSTSVGRESVYIEWVPALRTDPHNNAKLNIGSYQALQQIIINEFDGRPHWGKNGPYYFTKEIIKRRPRRLLRRFKQFMTAYDPNGVFMNKFGRRLLFQSDELTVHPKMKRCALLDYCLCRKDEDCASLQVCAKYDGRYPICKDKVDVEIPISK